MPIRPGTIFDMRTVVLGAGPAGCSAALALARRGHDVVLIDRDEPPEVAGVSADEIFQTWSRSAVGQFRQPHNFLGLGRTILRDAIPDVYADLFAKGAGEVRQADFLGAVEFEPGDEDLALINCRRPIIAFGDDRGDAGRCGLARQGGLGGQDGLGRQAVRASSSSSQRARSLISRLTSAVIFFVNGTSSCTAFTRNTLALRSTAASSFPTNRSR
jgi:hypothetical protein